ncbi:hypothetical protein IMZ48_05385 [Candidatus Bathyarchaeota archaeon]|nr:hypothetical protein [Candidatus Bathyarchaeota archaeon]
MALIHKLPPILKPDILFPWHSTSDETSQVLPSFLKLIQLFWIFDQSGIIEMLQNAECRPAANLYTGHLVSTCLELLQPRLQQLITDSDWGSGTDEQRADVFLTRQWMRAILWRAALRFGVADHALGTADPVGIAREFLALTARVPPGALESHGAALVSNLNILDQRSENCVPNTLWQEFKTFEIAATVVDAIAGNIRFGFPLDYVAATLFSLRDMLSSFRGGKTKLLPVLEAKMQSILGFGVPGRPLNVDDEQQTATAGLNEEDSSDPGGNPSQGEDHLTGLTMGVLSQDGTPFLWAEPDLVDLLDLPSLLTNIRPSTSVVETAEEPFSSYHWQLSHDTIDGNTFLQ